MIKDILCYPNEHMPTVSFQSYGASNRSGRDILSTSPTAKERANKALEKIDAQDKMGSQTFHINNAPSKLSSGAHSVRKETTTYHELLERAKKLRS